MVDITNLICEFEGCNQDSSYWIEWYSFSRYKKDKSIVDSRYSCEDHLINISNNDYGFPDKIYYVHRSGIFETFHEDDGLLEKIKDDLDPSRKQLELF